ncbi:MAG: NAD(P)-dependent oxidoreductase [Oscillatoriales cyanobacterium]|nr:MAG: NAD(P)-dependent oxidoreductase [Oscillatoriales cyanobacterium]
MTSVAVLGMGLMGRAAAGRLAALGQSVVAWNRSPAALAELPTTDRLSVTTDLASAIAPAERVVLWLADGAAIRSVLLDGAIGSQLAGKTVVQMGTIAPEESRSIATDLAALGVDYYEAPVLGSIPELSAGKLLLMVGATPAQFDRERAWLQTFGPEPLLVGPVGAAAALKLAMNQLIGSLTTAFAASLALVEREGIEIETFLQILRPSALYAPTFDKKLQRMLDRDFDRPNFPTKHLLKDLDLFNQAATAQGIDTAPVQAVRAVVQRAIALGLGNTDYSALFAAIAPEGAEPERTL